MSPAAGQAGGWSPGEGWLSGSGRGHWARVTQGESHRVTHSSGCCSQSLQPGGTPSSARALGILELAALQTTLLGSSVLQALVCW